MPLAPDTTQTTMGLGAVGVAINGVAIFDNQAAPGDDIFQESGSFDQCRGHPAPGGVYHYHSEPYAISSATANLIGVLQATATSFTASSTPTAPCRRSTRRRPHRHHARQPTRPSTTTTSICRSTSAGTRDERVEFLTTGTYEGTPG